eukprot:TRINITY_DN29749_c0_g1_i1.p1 TRINITY_DN29749_c0_g1~~TRINITY_DN29749_c0_g1_i1.p1  ORF type:complete len:278 (-),score=59.03 TRINITY_DN29749_c0_g1_i1:20-853(-)
MLPKVKIVEQTDLWLDTVHVMTDMDRINAERDARNMSKMTYSIESEIKPFFKCEAGVEEIGIRPYAIGLDNQMNNIVKTYTIYVSWDANEETITIPEGHYLPQQIADTFNNLLYEQGVPSSFEMSVTENYDFQMISPDTDITFNFKRGAAIDFQKQLGYKNSIFTVEAGSVYLQEYCPNLRAPLVYVHIESQDPSNVFMAKNLTGNAPVAILRSPTIKAPFDFTARHEGEYALFGKGTSFQSMNVKLCDKYGNLLKLNVADWYIGLRVVKFRYDKES